MVQVLPYLTQLLRVLIVVSQCHDFSWCKPNHFRTTIRRETSFVPFKSVIPTVAEFGALDAGDLQS